MKYREVIAELKTMARVRSDDRLAVLAERGRVRAFKVELVGTGVVFVVVVLPLTVAVARLSPPLGYLVTTAGLLLGWGALWWWNRMVDADVLVALSRGAGEVGLAICSKCGYIMEAPGSDKCPECDGPFLGTRQKGIV